MRIISQNGMNDYPYEQCYVFVNYKERTKLCIAMCGDSDFYAEMGEYNSEEDAKFVLEFVNTSYMIGSHSIYLPDAEVAATLRNRYMENRKEDERYYTYLKRMGAHKA